MTSSWSFLSTLNYDARSTTHQICNILVVLSEWNTTETTLLLSVNLKDETNMGEKCVGARRILKGLRKGYDVVLLQHQWRTREFCSGGVQQIQLRIMDGENGDLGAVAP